MPSKLFGDKRPLRQGLVQQGKGGIPGEVGDLRADVESAFNKMEVNGGYLHTDEFTNPPAASTTAIKTAAATAATAQVFTAAAGSFNGSVGAAEMVPPRNITITTNTNANILAVAVVIEGEVRDAYGNLIPQTDTITLTAGGGVTNAGTKAFSKVTRISSPPHGGAAGTMAFGYGVLLGLGRKMRAVAGLLAPVREVVNGAVVTTGTFAVTAPHGTYSPASAANGSNDYGVSYIVGA